MMRNLYTKAELLTREEEAEFSKNILYTTNLELLVKQINKAF